MMNDVLVKDGNNKFLDPRTKLLLILIISLVSLTVNDMVPVVYIRLIFMIIPSVLIIVIGRYWIGFIFMMLIIMAWLVESMIAMQYNPVLTILIFIVAGIITRFLPALLMGYYILKTTEVEQFISSLERMEFPRKLTIPLAVMFRFIPTIREESKAIRDAMKMRGINLKFALKHPVKFIEYRLVPLLNSVIKIGNELTMASITRGLALNYSRTVMTTLKLRLFDWVLMIVAVVFCVLYYLI
ncbi:energy-coupling factor transporter transmembrane component T [Staphylococcus sp. ACRSN]|uniref:energy-coupling factor transporter transmembrane component T n=1 Tax=Staphylococcus sp. ACRSN TaxID=2918214 RepID=UPI001EF22799|nr:energy-coupling factor transporter transmembrane component T [Staphylococcus sp. ACRSN]